MSKLVNSFSNSLNPEKVPLVEASAEADEIDDPTKWNDARDAKASVPTTAVNLICNIFGGALLVLPTTMVNMSVIPGSIFVLIMGFCSTASMAMLILSARSVSKYTYKDLLTSAFNDKAGKAFDIVLMLYTYGILVEYARILADTMPSAMTDLVGHDGVWSHQLFWLGISFVIFWALSSLRRFSELKISSYLGVATIFYAVFLVITRYFMGTYSPPGQGGLNRPNIPWFRLSTDFFKGIPVLSVSYSCHYNIAPFYREMKDRTAKKYLKAVLAAIPVISVSYIFVGITGVLMFGESCLESTGGDITKAFPQSDTAAVVGRLGLFLHFSSVFPIIAMATRRCLNQLIFGSPIQPIYRYIIEAFFLVITSCTLAYLVKGIAEVLDLIGALFGLSIVYVIPSLVFIRLSPRVQEAEQARHDAKANGNMECLAEVDEAEPTMLGDTVPMWLITFLRRLAYGLVVAGLLASIISFTITLISAIKSSGQTPVSPLCFNFTDDWVGNATPSPMSWAPNFTTVAPNMTAVPSTPSP